jgi:hypothetical protein
MRADDTPHALDPGSDGHLLTHRRFRCGRRSDAATRCARLLIMCWCLLPGRCNERQPCGRIAPHKCPGRCDLDLARPVGGGGERTGGASRGEGRCRARRPADRAETRADRAERSSKTGLTCSGAGSLTRLATVEADARETARALREQNGEVGTAHRG